MKTLNCDVLVIGAGPAGSSAARAAALGGAQTMLVESRTVIGSPVQCAELIPIQLLSQLDLPETCLAQSIEGMKTFLPDGGLTLMRARGCMVHRDQFDQCLARQAVDAGAELVYGVRVLGRNPDGLVIARSRTHDDRHLRIKAKVIIGADGPKSTVGKWVDAVNTDLLCGVQVTMPLLKPEQFTRVYFDSEIFGGYCWLFPKNDQANIGLGMRPPEEGGKRPRTILNRFIDRFVAEGLVDGIVLSSACGWIPAGPIRSAVYGDVLLAGDAAGHTHPITGAGIYAAVTCGEMAGRHAAEAVKAGDLDLLQEYDAEWRSLFGTSLSRAASRRRLMESAWSSLDSTVKRTWVAFREYYA